MFTKQMPYTVRRLRRLLLSLARVPGQQEPVRLTITAASKDTLHFCTQDDMGDAEDVTLMMLLSGHGCVQFHAKVADVKRTSRSLYGELALQPDALAQSALHDYLNRPEEEG